MAVIFWKTAGIIMVLPSWHQRVSLLAVMHPAGCAPVKTSTAVPSVEARPKQPAHLSPCKLQAARVLKAKNGAAVGALKCGQGACCVFAPQNNIYQAKPPGGWYYIDTCPGGFVFALSAPIASTFGCVSATQGLAGRLRSHNVNNGSWYTYKLPLTKARTSSPLAMRKSHFWLQTAITMALSHYIHNR